MSSGLNRRLGIGWGKRRQQEVQGGGLDRIAGTTFKEARFRPPFSKNSIAFQKRLFYIPNQQYA